MVTERITRLARICMKEERVPENWQDGCAVPICKGKGDMSECKSFRGISNLSILGKVFDRLIDIGDGESGEKYEMRPNGEWEKGIAGFGREKG